MTGARVPSPTSTLRALCWCGHGYVRVPADEVRAGRTRPCRRTTCREGVPLTGNPLDPADPANGCRDCGAELEARRGRVGRPPVRCDDCRAST